MSDPVHVDTNPPPALISSACLPVTSQKPRRWLVVTLMSLGATAILVANWMFPFFGSVSGATTGSDFNPQTSRTTSSPSLLPVNGNSMTQHRELGIIRPKETVSAKFAVSNPTADRLVVSRVHTTCACTIASPAFQFLDPGKSKEVEVTYRAGDKSTDFRQYVQIFFGEGKQSALLEVTGAIRAELVTAPERVIIPRLGKGQTAEQRIEVRNYSDADCEPIVASSSSWLSVPEIVALPKEHGRNSARQAWRLTLRADASSLSSGEHRTDLAVTAGVHHCILSVTTTVLAAATAIPGEFFFGRVPPGEQRECRVTVWFTTDVRPTSAEDFRLDSSLGDELVVKSLPSALSDRWILVATLKPRGTEKFIDGLVNVRIAQNIPGGLQIPVRGRVAP